jgi:conjugal transfer/entry exclusion protein
VKHRSIKFVVSAAVASLVLSGAPASAQGLPVVDPGNIAQTIKVVQNGMQQVQKIQEQVKQMEGMAKTIGSNGPLAMATDLLKKAGMDFASAENSPLAPYRSAMPGLLDALPGSQVGGSLAISKNLAEQAKTNIGYGREFALKAFYKSGEATVDEIQKRQGVREAAMRDSVTAGYAMAVYTKNDLGQTEGRMKALSDGVSAAKDLRSDVQSNSAIALAQLQQMTVQNQLLSQLLEVQSTSAMASQTNNVQ